MKRRWRIGPWGVVVSSLTLWALSLAVAWSYGTVKANARVREILVNAEESYSEVIYGEIEAALRNVGGSLLNVFDGRCEPQSPERMRELARTYNLDEINVVDARGRVLATNVDSVRGADFTSHPLTREFMALTNAAVTRVSQPFRHGVNNADMYCAYYGLAFPGHVGFLQLGITLDRLRQNMYSYTVEEAERILREWHFSGEGWYERIAEGETCESGRFAVRTDPATGERAFTRDFTFKGYEYRAVLPVSFRDRRRHSIFFGIAFVVTAVLALLTLILVKLVVTLRKVGILHAEAAQRTLGDLRLARRIQMSALPPSAGAFPQWLEFTLAAESHPAREVGGDFYDFFPLPDGRIAFVVADVSGKGIPAALFMMEAKGVLRGSLVTGAGLAEAVTEANSRLCAANEAEMFVTAWIGALDPHCGRIEYVNAGHNRPFVRRADATVEKVMGKGGFFLGLFEQATYVAHELQLEKGDRLFVSTDGVTEAMNAEKRQFGEARLVAALKANRVREALEEFVSAAEQSDDLTVLTVDWQGAPATVTRSFPCDAESLAEAVDFLRSALAGVEPKTLARILNAADEVMANVVGYSGSRECEITVRRVRCRVRLEFRDAGRPYDPLTHRDPDPTAPIEARPVGGLGLMMVKRLMDRVAYAREGDCNVLRLDKNL